MKYGILDYQKTGEHSQLQELLATGYRYCGTPVTGDSEGQTRSVVAWNGAQVYLILSLSQETRIGELLWSVLQWEENKTFYKFWSNSHSA